MSPIFLTGQTLVKMELFLVFMNLLAITCAHPLSHNDYQTLMSKLEEQQGEIEDFKSLSGQFGVRFKGLVESEVTLRNGQYEARIKELESEVATLKSGGYV